MTSRAGAIGFCLAAALGAAIVACGKDSSSASPSATPTPTATATPMPALTITITSTGASPKTLTVAAGSQVTFVNNDSIDHQMYSDPHPEHTDCPELDSVGYLAPGQSRQTENLNTVRSCGFHDHIHFDNNALKGSITIQ
jgi:plastocyanin